MLERITATIFLTILFPVFALISVSIFFFSGRPILFKHKRCGYKFDEFYVIKFRTMRPNKGPSLTGFQDKRITGIGKILRKLKLFGVHGRKIIQVVEIIIKLMLEYCKVLIYNRQLNM